jgi:hypothetical protein
LVLWYPNFNSWLFIKHNVQIYKLLFSNILFLIQAHSWIAYMTLYFLNG